MKPIAVLFFFFVLEFLCHFGLHMTKKGRVLSCKANWGREILDPLQSAPQKGHVSTILQRRQGDEITKVLLYYAS